MENSQKVCARENWKENCLKETFRPNLKLEYFSRTDCMILFSVNNQSALFVAAVGEFGTSQVEGKDDLWSFKCLCPEGKILFPPIVDKQCGFFLPVSWNWHCLRV